MDSRKTSRSLGHFLWPWHWDKVRDTGINVYLQCACGKRKVRTRPRGHQPIDRGWLETGEWTPRPTSWPMVGFGVWRPSRDH